MPTNTGNQTIITPEGYEVTYLQITPAVAKRLLDQNTNNRTVRSGNLRKIENDMSNGRWLFNGDAIRIDATGKIIDGQHRLLTIEKLGTTVPALLVSGLPPQARATIDTNAVRTAADELHMLGYTSATSLAAHASAYLRFNRSGLRAAVDPQSMSTTGAGITTSMIIDAVQSNQIIQDLTRTSSTRQYKGLTRTMASIVYYAFTQVPDPDAVTDADYFFARLRDGAQLPIDSPILRLRTNLVKLHNNRSNRASNSYVAGMTIKAWNAYRQGKPVRNLSYRQGGANPEAFPMPV